ncbi:MAG: hypothetical protein M3Y26_00315, partial [Actinomycetota bacterium]|nr:hypothetical protein [Actinomycetota bacterium]
MSSGLWSDAGDSSEADASIVSAAGWVTGASALGDGAVRASNWRARSSTTAAGVAAAAVAAAALARERGLAVA